MRTLHNTRPSGVVGGVGGGRVSRGLGVSEAKENMFGVYAHFQRGPDGLPALVVPRIDNFFMSVT